MKKEQHQQSHNPFESPKQAKYEKIKRKYFSRKRYLLEGNIFSRLFFLWASPILTYGSRFFIDQKSVPELKVSDLPSNDFYKLSKEFELRLTEGQNSRKGAKLTKSFIITFKNDIIASLVSSVLISSVYLYNPILSHNIIEYVTDGTQSTGTSLTYFFAMLLSGVSMVVMQANYWNWLAVFGYNLSNTLSLLIYNKALKHPLLTQKRYTVGDIINYSQVDAESIIEQIQNFTIVLEMPFYLLFGFGMLYYYIGISFLAGLAGLVILVFTSALLTKLSATVNQQLLQAKDERMKTTQETLQIIKYIKVNALQKYFFQKINKKREKQLRLINKLNILNITASFIYWAYPSLMTSLTFLMYIYLGNEVTPAKTFFIILVFNALDYHVRNFPTFLKGMVKIWTSLKRIEQFLLSSEIDTKFIKKSQDKKSKYAVQIEKGSFLWGKQLQSKQKQEKSANKASNKKKSSIMTEQQIQQNLQQSLISTNTQIISDPIIKSEKYSQALKDIEIKFPTGQVTMIIGDIGSGKSSILYAILNQMTPDKGKEPVVKLNGSIAYSPQKAWMMAATIRQNITIFEPEDKDRLNDAIFYSSLENDLKLLNNGLDTEIGERGVTLSGGQKARVSLARAIYSNKDIYLLDDILSAVDVHVGKFIMQKTILGYLKSKTVIMPTHAINYLDRADNIVIMEKGRIVAFGPYKEISQSKQFKTILQKQTKLKQEYKQQQSDQQEEEAIKMMEYRKLSKQSDKSQQKHKPHQIQEETEKVIEQLMLPEDQQQGKVSFQIYKSYVKLNGGWIFLTAVFFCLFAWSAFTIISTVVIQTWCDDQVKANKYLYMFIAFSFIAIIFSGCVSYILILSGIKQGRKVHMKITKALLYASITKFYNRVPTGRILNRLSKDLQVLDEAIGYQMENVLIMFFFVMQTFFMCTYTTTPLILIPVCIVLFTCYRIVLYYLKTQRECVRMQRISASPIVSGFTSAINGMPTIRAYKLQQKMLNQQMKKVTRSKQMRMLTEGLESWLTIRLGIISYIVNLGAVGYCLFASKQEAAFIGLLLIYSGIMNYDVVLCAYFYGNLELKMISIERLLHFVKLEPEPGYAQYCSKWRTKQEGAQKCIVHGDIQFKSYSARYRDDLPLVIKGISFKIQKGQKVGIVGRTGAGKSTLINCLLRIIDPVSGSIQIDGKDIREYQLKDLRSCITMIEQEPTLINGTFRQNLDPTFNHSDDEIIQILKQCNLFEMVEQKGGLQARATNENLSVGERQLVCICRAFLKKSRVILIDQATANIDVKNDKLVQDVIARAFKQSTVLTIAHRLSTLKSSDKIVVMSQGRVAQLGSPEELMKIPSGIYRKMCEENDSSYLD